VNGGRQSGRGEPSRNEEVVMAGLVPAIRVFDVAAASYKMCNGGWMRRCTKRQISWIIRAKDGQLSLGLNPIF
jgi:hypothetical protein